MSRLAGVACVALIAAVLAVLAACGTAPAPPPTPGAAIVALVTIEGLGRSALAAAAGAAPHLEGLGGGGGEPVFTPCPSVVPAIASLMTGEAPSELGVLDNYGARVAAGVPLLAGDFAAGGWTTAAFVANPVLAALAGVDRDVAVFDGATGFAFGLFRHYPEVRPAGRVAANAAQWIGSLPAGGRAFVWVHLSDLGEPRLEGATGPPGDARSRLAAVDAAVGTIRAALSAKADRGLLVVAGDRGRLVHAGADLGQGFFLEPENVAVYYAEANLGSGAEAMAAPRPRGLADVGARLAAAAGLPTRSAPAAVSPAPRVVSVSAVPWLWFRWPAAVAVEWEQDLFIFDGAWRRSRALGAPQALEAGAVPEAVRAAARDAIVPLEAVPPPGPAALDLAAATAAAGIRLGSETYRVAPSDRDTRRATVARLQMARAMAVFGQVDQALEMLRPLVDADPPALAALADGMLMHAMRPVASATDWELGKRALTRYGAAPQALHWMAHAAIRRADRGLAQTMLLAVLERIPDDADALYDLACVRSLAGDLDGAESWLRRSVAVGFRQWEMIESDPDLRNLRADPRFGALMRSWGR